jgi:hypothetical protein
MNHDEDCIKSGFPVSEDGENGDATDEIQDRQLFTCSRNVHGGIVQNETL